MSWNFSRKNFSKNYYLIISELRSSGFLFHSSKKWDWLVLLFCSMGVDELSQGNGTFSWNIARKAQLGWVSDCREIPIGNQASYSIMEELSNSHQRNKDNSSILQYMASFSIGRLDSCKWERHFKANYLTINKLSYRWYS